MPGSDTISLIRGVGHRISLRAPRNPQDFAGFDPVRSHEIKKKVFILGK
jgi:hypothetical protein